MMNNKIDKYIWLRYSAHDKNVVMVKIIVGEKTVYKELLR